MASGQGIHTAQNLQIVYHACSCVWGQRSQQQGVIYYLPVGFFDSIGMIYNLFCIRLTNFYTNLLYV